MTPSSETRQAERASYGMVTVEALTGSLHSLWWQKTDCLWHLHTHSHLGCWDVTGSEDKYIHSGLGHWGWSYFYGEKHKSRGNVDQRLAVGRLRLDFIFVAYVRLDLMIGRFVHGPSSASVMPSPIATADDYHELMPRNQQWANQSHKLYIVFLIHSVLHSYSCFASRYHTTVVNIKTLIFDHVLCQAHVDKLRIHRVW